MCLLWVTCLFSLLTSVVVFLSMIPSSVWFSLYLSIQTPSRWSHVFLKHVLLLLDWHWHLIQREGRGMKMKANSICALPFPIILFSFDYIFLGSSPLLLSSLVSLLFIVFGFLLSISFYLFHSILFFHFLGDLLTCVSCFFLFLCTIGSCLVSHLIFLWDTKARNTLFFQCYQYSSRLLIHIVLRSMTEKERKKRGYEISRQQKDCFQTTRQNHRKYHIFKEKYWHWILIKGSLSQETSKAKIT